MYHCADSMQEQRQTLHYYFHTLPTAFLTCYLIRIIEHVIIGPLRVLWELLFTKLTLIRFEKGKTVLMLCLHVSHSRL